mmetsp:Transcript_175078/g.426012  ORF Transcript_175078/g.426012 Transcript_175078/m.426012 type:complete len:97 (+) Transcript_175078:29-319(+)
MLPFDFLRPAMGCMTSNKCEKGGRGLVDHGCCVRAGAVSQDGYEQGTIVIIFRGIEDEVLVDPGTIQHANPDAWTVAEKAGKANAKLEVPCQTVRK